MFQKYELIFNFVFSNKSTYVKSLLEDLERFAYKQLHSHYNHTKKGNKIHFTRIEYEHHEDLCHKLDVKTLPELQWVVDGKVKATYTEKRMTLKSIKRFIAVSYFKTIFNNLYVREWEAMMRAHDLNIIYFGKDDAPGARALSHWTQFHHDDFKGLGFWHIDPKDKHIADDMGLDEEHIGLYRSSDRKLVLYNSSIYSGKMLRDWIFVHAYPPAPILDEYHASRFVEHQFPVFVLWISQTFKPATLEKIMEFQAAAEQFPDNQYLGLVAEISNRHIVDTLLARNMEFRPKKDLPCVKFYNPISHSHQKHDHELFEQYTLRGDLSKEKILAFMRGIRNRNANIRPDHLSQKGIQLNDKLLIQDMGASSLHDPIYEAMKNHVD